MLFQELLSLVQVFLTNISVFFKDYFTNTSFQEIYTFIETNFMNIAICLGLVGVAISIASTVIRVIAVLIVILLCIKIFFLA